MSSTARSVRGCLITCGLVAALGTWTFAQDRVNAHGAMVKAFQDRVNAYVKLHDDVANKLPKLNETSDPAKLHSREVALGQALQQARAGVKPGVLFGSDFGPFLRKLIRDDWRRRSRADRRSMMEEVPRDPVRINELYPTTHPLATFPAKLLEVMPPLPEDLEYRFYGRHLIIRDIDANLVVDILPNAVPAT